MSGEGGYFPVALRMSGRKAVILGGDQEAVIKAEKLLRCGARVTVVSSEPHPAIVRLSDSGDLHLFRRPYCGGDLEGATIAIVCDHSALPAAAQEARQRNVLLNVLDDTSRCDFIAVAYFERDGLQIAIHSSAKSAALARRLRERLESRYGSAYSELTRTLGELRPVVKQVITVPAVRRKYWLELVSHDLLDRIDADGFDPRTFKSDALERAIRLVEESRRTPIPASTEGTVL